MARHTTSQTSNRTQGHGQNTGTPSIQHPEWVSLPTDHPAGETDGTYGFQLNSLKNYLGVPIAIAADGATGGLINQYLVRMAGEARGGATALGLITPGGELTNRGSLLVETATTDGLSPTTALEELGELYGKPTRFIDAFPEWQDTVQALLSRYTPVDYVLNALIGERHTLPTAVAALSTLAPTYTYKSILSQQAIPDSTPLETLTEHHHSTVSLDEYPSWALRPESYNSAFICQFKSLLYDGGLLTQSGTDTVNLTPETDVWALETTTIADPLEKRLRTTGGLAGGDN